MRVCLGVGDKTDCLVIVYMRFCCYLSICCCCWCMQKSSQILKQQREEREKNSRRAMRTTHIYSLLAFLFYALDVECFHIVMAQTYTHIAHCLHSHFCTMCLLTGNVHTEMKKKHAVAVEILCAEDARGGAVSFRIVNKSNQFFYYKISSAV